MPRRWRIYGSICALAIVFACTGEDPTFITPTETTDAGTDAPPSNTDANVAVDGGTDSGARFCDTKTKPGGAAEFFCADFDGEPYDQGWTSHFDRDATVSAISTPVLSAPRAILAPVEAIADAAVKDHGAALEWLTNGALPVDRIEVDVALNKRDDNEGAPKLKGNVTLVSVETTDGRTGVVFTRGATVSGTIDYVGYYVFVEALNPPNFTVFKANSSIPNETWAKVKLVANLKNGTTDLFFNGIQVVTNVGSVKHTTTAAAVRVGAVGRSATIDHAFRFDDVTVAVFR